MLKSTKYFIIDMDGTFYLSSKIINGATEFVNAVKKSGREFRFFTNNSSNSSSVCCEKLKKMGFDTPESNIIVSSHVAADYINKHYKGKKVYLLGNENLKKDMLCADIILCDNNPDIVLLGFDTTLTYEKIRKAAGYIANGCIYLATHPDLNCPTADGFIPDTGSMIELFAASTGKRPLVLGKPETATVDYLTSLLKCERNELAFIGDRLETDILIGQKHNIPTCLVFSGVTTPQMYNKSNIKATITADNLGKLVSYL